MQMPSCDSIWRELQWNLHHPVHRPRWTGMAQLKRDLHMQLSPGSSLQKMFVPMGLSQGGVHILRWLEIKTDTLIYHRNFKHYFSGDPKLTSKIRSTRVLNESKDHAITSQISVLASEDVRLEFRTESAKRLSRVLDDPPRTASKDINSKCCWASAPSP